MSVIKYSSCIYITLLVLGSLTSTAFATATKTEAEYQTVHQTNLDSPQLGSLTSTAFATATKTEAEYQTVHQTNLDSPQLGSLTSTAFATATKTEAEYQRTYQTNLDSPKLRYLSSNAFTTATETEAEHQTAHETNIDSAKQAVNPRLSVGFTTGPGVGYESSFGSFEAFVPLSQSMGKSVTFLEGRLLLSTENSLTSGNIILGHRFLSPKGDRLHGASIAYDMRNTGKSNFHQVAVGVESLGESWDIRANAYIPVGETRQLTEEKIVKTATSFSEPFFQGNFLAQTRNQQQQINRRWEAAMTGFDLEAGVKIAQLGETGDLRGYAGVYYYDAAGSSGILGGRARLEVRPTDTLKLGLSLSSDATFGTNIVLRVAASFPNNRPSGKGKAERLLARLGEPVTRTPNIVVESQFKSESFSVQDTVFVTNPATGEPWRFRHVNLGIGTGNATFENPTGTVAAALNVAVPNDIVYVQPGTNPGIPAFRIPDKVQVLSTSPVQRIDTVESGKIQLPLSGAGVMPIVTGRAIVGNNITISGLFFQTNSNSGIYGTNISNVIIRDNAITNAAREGILLENVTGKVAITNNSINNANAEGFSLKNNFGQVELTLTENQIANNGKAGDEGDGVKVELRNNAQGTFNISNNQIANNRGISGIADGIDIKLFNNAQALFNITNNQIIGNQFRGTSIELESTAQATFNLTNNTISDNQADATYIKLSETAQGTFTIDNNQITRNGIYGIGIFLADRTKGTFYLTNNRIAENQDNGVFIQLSNNAQGTVSIANNQQITQNGSFGIFTTTNQNTVLRLLVESNNITDNPLSGLSISSFDASQVFAAVRLNTINGNNLSDFEATTISPRATICLQPRNNTIGSLILLDTVGGTVQVESETFPTNKISLINPVGWSGSTVPTGTCGF
ncbi:MAG: right-handed parallel beta-helix repeat-containing protein [Potamolinea sp.]